MKLKNILIVVGILLVASAAAWFLQRPPPPPAQDARVTKPVLDAAIAPKAGQIRLTDQGKTVQLAKQADGTWRVASYHDFPADFTKIGRLVGDLTEAKVQRLVTTKPDRLARLEFKDTSITLVESPDKELWAITLGKNAEGGGRFLRYGKEAKGYQANLNVWLDAEPKNWADAALLNLKQEDIAKVEVGFAGGKAVAASRAKKEDPWSGADAPSGKQIKVDKITSVLSNLTSLRFSDTNDLTDANAVAAKSNSRTIKLTTFDGKTYTVALGRKPEEKKLKPPAPKPTESAPAADKVGATAPSSPSAPADKVGAAAPSGPSTSATPAPTADKVGAAAPGSPSAADTKPADAKPPEPEYETIPAGPVFAIVTSSDEKATVNAIMQKRAFQIYEYAFTSLPANVDEMWEDKPAPPPPPAPAAVAAPAAAPVSGVPVTSPATSKADAKPATAPAPAAPKPEEKPAAPKS